MQGRPVEERRAEHIAELIKELDKNGDKKLTRDEANASTIFRKTARKGTETFLRKDEIEFQASRFGTRLGYDGQKVAGQPVVFRQNDDAYENDEYIFGLLDDDKSGILDEEEIATAAQRLTSLDLDEDECIGFDEVQPPPVQTADPQLVALGLATEPAAVSHSMFSDLMRRTSERALPNKMIGKYDLNGNGKLSPRELRWEADRLTSIDENKDGELSRSEMKKLDQTPVDVDLTVDVSSIDKSEPAMNVRHCRGEKLTNRHRPGIVHFVMHDSTVTISYRHSDPVAESLETRGESSTPSTPTSTATSTNQRSLVKRYLSAACLIAWTLTAMKNSSAKRWIFTFASGQRSNPWRAASTSSTRAADFSKPWITTTTVAFPFVKCGSVRNR